MVIDPNISLIKSKNMKTTILLLLTISLIGCTELKSVGRDIGHAAKGVTKTVGHATRDTTKVVGHASRDTVKAVGHTTRDAVKEVVE